MFKYLSSTFFKLKLSLGSFLIDLETFIYVVIGLLSLDFLLTRDNLRIAKKFFLLNLSVGLILLFQKAYIGFFVSSVTSVFVFGITYILANEEYQRESYQDTWVDVSTIIIVLALIGILSVILMKFPLLEQSIDLASSDALFLENLIKSFKIPLLLFSCASFLTVIFISRAERIFNKGNKE